MNAVVFEKYGKPEVLQLKEIAKPQPKDNEVLIQVKAITVTSGDWQLRKGEPFAIRLAFGLTKPKNQILGFEFARIVESTGKSVTKFRTGDTVFGYQTSGGTYAEYLTIPEDGILLNKPENLSFDEAAAIPNGAITSLYFLKKANIEAGQSVLIYGASGSVGTYAVQLAKYFGAKVTAVCSTSNINLANLNGANKVIDYTREDFAKSSESYDIIFDTIGKTSYTQCKNILKPKGKYVLCSFGIFHILQMIINSFSSSKKIICDIMKPDKKQLQFLKQITEEGKLKPIIDSIYTVDEIIDAHQYVETGRKKGNVVVSFSPY
ncbi:NAD(P)-dependent alcohol dehydrogenase [Chondrinema litorale]|uniref:NAD(P)-dependent alcohol dehydrogenase n=1 Tax=Chondrinema litorale TaxID=2994555 RepID=UPI002542C524|nr:NAD(P)-dependent alcohol dehydrogenase [Chondrinema litorale]UZR98051.1 NAD(P)-dependent alcohol dehydrogenase [Chondrinema litorale]